MDFDLPFLSGVLWGSCVSRFGAFSSVSPRVPKKLKELHEQGFRRHKLDARGFSSHMGVEPKMVGFSATNPWGFPTTNDQHLGCDMGGNPPFKETPICFGSFGPPKLVLGRFTIRLPKTNDFNDLRASFFFGRLGQKNYPTTWGVCDVAFCWVVLRVLGWVCFGELRCWVFGSETFTDFLADLFDQLFQSSVCAIRKVLGPHSATPKNLVGKTLKLILNS